MLSMICFVFQADVLLRVRDGGAAALRLEFRSVPQEVPGAQAWRQELTLQAGL